jgi:hypothetical protein
MSVADLIRKTSLGWSPSTSWHAEEVIFEKAGKWVKRAQRTQPTGKDYRRSFTEFV